MELVRGFIHPIREDIDYRAIQQNIKVELILGVDDFVSAIGTDQINSFGIKFKLSLLDRTNGYEIIGFTIESGVIFSAIGDPKEDLVIINEAITQAFDNCVAYVLKRVDIPIIKIEQLPPQNYWQHGARIITKLIEHGLYS